MKTQYTAEGLAQFRREIADKVPQVERAYSPYTRQTSPVMNDFTIEEINEIIRSGDPVLTRELSNYYYRRSGVYNRLINYMANIISYDTVIIPKYDTSSPPLKATLLKQYSAANKFLDSLQIRRNAPHFTQTILRDGVYYGLLREDPEGRITFQDLPPQYCRSKFKDYNGLSILEFDLNYFNTIADERIREKVVRAYPAIISAAYFAKKRTSERWVEVRPDDGGVVFYFEEFFPLFAAAIPSILQFEAAKDRETQRDQNELTKLLIQKLPMDKNTGEMIFDLPEAQEIHKTTVSMVKNNPTIDVLTTFADVDLHSVQETSAATQSSDRIDKYKNAVYDELGVSSMLFNATSNTSTVQSIHKDIALMMAWAQTYEVWMCTLVNNRFGKNKIRFDIEILPTNEYFRTDIVNLYLKAAQYGYSKMYAGVALGIKQDSLQSLTHFENDILNLADTMRPLQSSYTSTTVENNSTKKNKKEETGIDNITPKDISNEGGRPAKDEQAKADKTIANQNGAS